MGEHLLNICIWDTAGQERYRSLIKQYLRGTRGALVFYDITDRDTLRGVDYWMETLKKETSEDVPIILVGSKADLESQREVPTEEGWACAERPRSEPKEHQG